MFSLIGNITTEYLILLLYGAAFLFLGVSIAAKSMKGSDLGLASSLWMLSAFGFLHGGHEWVELGLLIEGGNLTFRQLFWIKVFSTALVVVSFVFLLRFGISLVRARGDKKYKFLALLSLPLALMWALHVWYFGFHEEGFHIDMQSLRQANLASRYTFGFVGSLLTAYGLYVNSGEVMNLSRQVSQKLRYAAVAFCFYAPLAGILPSWYTFPLIDVPVVVFRGIAAFLITYLMTKALNIFDIEMRMKYEEQAKSILQAEKLASIGRLAAGIAHEINNPLARASLVVQTLKREAGEGIKTQNLAERLDAVERSIDKASAIAGELLQFARQKEPKMILLDVREPLSGALTLLDHRLKQVTVVRDLVAVPPVYGDPDKLEQVFINVLANAMEALPEGGEIVISTARVNGSVMVRISDNGTGITQEDLPRVFDPFFTTKEVGKGTGLGLAICYGIVRQHRGEITLTSAPDRGTTVSIKLPAKVES